MRRYDVGDGPCAVPWRDRGFQITQTGITKACTSDGAGFFFGFMSSVPIFPVRGRLRQDPAMGAW